jgi:hypothetical protein
MQYLVSALALFFVTHAWAGKDPEISSDSQIRSFLGSPGVQNFNYPDPTHWKSYRKYIQLGTWMPDGSCRYRYESISSSKQAFVRKAIAVDRAGCRSLMLEGVPDDATLAQWKQIQQAIHPGSRLPGQTAGKTVTIRQDATSGAQRLINRNSAVSTSILAG